MHTPTQIEKRLETEGVVFANAEELKTFFDSQARKLVGMPGDEAIDHIRAGKIGNDIAWSELAQIYLLL
jgi:hypothetical protein